MTAELSTDVIVGGRPGAAAGRATFTALAARETRRLARNPVFLAAAALTAFFLWSGQRSTITAIEDVNAIAAVCFGGLGMMATFGLTRSMHASEPVVGVTPVTRTARTAALCATAIVPFGCGCLTLLAFLQLIPVSSALYGAFSPSARIAVLVGQIVMPALGGRQIGGYACACSTQINYVSLLLDRLLRPVRAAARTRSRCLAQVRHPQDPGIL